jgi:predicted MFS family arabinose efflux permease
MLVPLSAWQPAAAVPLLMSSSFVAGLAITLGSIGELSLRQGMTRQRLQGRMNATMRSLNWSMASVGALVGGVLGDSLGLAATLLVGALGSLLSALWLIFSPVRNLRSVPSDARGPPD